LEIQDDNNILTVRALIPIFQLCKNLTSLKITKCFEIKHADWISLFSTYTPNLIHTLTLVNCTHLKEDSILSEIQTLSDGKTKVVFVLED
jgi:hypothetical protein